MEKLIQKQPLASRWIHQLPSSSVLLDNNLNLIDASTTWFKTFGFDRSKTIGKPFLKLFARFDESWQDSFDYALEGLNDIQIIDTHIGENGAEQDFIWNINPWKDGYGKSIGVILNVKDVSEKTALEIELKNTQKLLKEKGAIAKIGSWEYNVNNQKMYWSKELKEIFQIDHLEAASYKKSVAFFKKGHDRNTITTLFHTALEMGKPWNKNLKLTTKKGDTIWVNTIGRPKFKNGKCVRIIGTIQNINDSYSPEISTPAKNEVSQDSWAAFENLPIGVVKIDLRSGEVLDLNNEILNVLGFQKHMLLNRNIAKFLWFSEDEQKQWYKSILINKAFNGLEKQVFFEDLDQKLVFRFNGTLLPDNSLLVSCENITSYQNKEGQIKAELDLANAELDRLTHFTHMVSHNLKAHATNQDLLLNFLSDEKNEAERKNLLTILFKSSENLTSSIKGLRELVTIRHKINEQKVPVLLNDIIYRTLENNNGLVKQHGVKIHNEVSEKFTVRAVPVYLENIVSSLLVNAIKFKNSNKQPVVFVSTQVVDDYYIFSIEDNGIGIDLNKKGDKIFQLYKTLQNMDSSSGMGLYLAKYQIELMGGKITVDSTLDKGSIFRVYLPI